MSEVVAQSSAVGPRRGQEVGVHARYQERRGGLGGVFVVETVGVSPSLVDDQLTLLSSDQAYSVERYWLSDDGRQLETQVTIHDPVMLRAPLTINRPRVLTPDVELDRAPCEAIAGQF